MICLEWRPVAKVIVTRKQNMTLPSPKMYPNAKLGIPTLNNIGTMFLIQFSRTEERG